MAPKVVDNGKVPLTREQATLAQEVFEGRLGLLDKVGGLDPFCSPTEGGFGSYVEEKLMRHEFAHFDEGPVSKELLDRNKDAAKLLEDYCRQNPDKRQVIAQLVTGVRMEEVDSWGNDYRSLSDDVTGAMETLRRPYSKLRNYSSIELMGIPPEGIKYSDWCRQIKAMTPAPSLSEVNSYFGTSGKDLDGSLAVMLKGLSKKTVA